MLWDLAEGKRLYSLDAGDVIHALCFSPNRYWLVAATQQVIKVGRRPPGVVQETFQCSADVIYIACGNRDCRSPCCSSWCRCMPFIAVLP